MQVSQRIGFTGSALTRLLARMAENNAADAREAGPGFADRLGEWLRWTDAISLSSALGAGPAAAAPQGARVPTATLESECAGLRNALANAIGADGAFTAPAKEAPTDFPSYRRRYLARQQTMETAIGPQRERLRSILAARSPAMARLAAVDAVMEEVLGVQQHNLLAGIPSRLEKHFARLRRAEPAPDEEPEGEARPGPWLDLFRNDMRDLLLAELDFRLQPIEGLLEALK
ncbi:DUF3348 domain-containing protein [Variovorax sp. JS1663]|uniref:DUF3348 domain-containing protein n=1 Tax=Variovorax sp. JS1663 TaxID=1851577 RepID=UPI000B34600B|nr:DUF3348 domain-containing protein [Variovorax sp. JS1663]OUM02545.1 hypothetical protein A8M77_09725 [Variovorax sp. JS1663]